MRGRAGGCSEFGNCHLALHCQRKYGAPNVHIVFWTLEDGKHGQLRLRKTSDLQGSYRYYVLYHNKRELPMGQNKDTVVASYQYEHVITKAHRLGHPHPRRCTTASP